VFEPKVLTHIPYSQYLDLPDLVKKMISAGEKVLGFPYTGYWQDLGRPDDYEHASHDFESMRNNFLLED
jgi:NDP-sugar pyrophosphorylase family protein